jgi:hypothetical protein
MLDYFSSNKPLYSASILSHYIKGAVCHRWAIGDAKKHRNNNHCHISGIRLGAGADVGHDARLADGQERLAYQSGNHHQGYGFDQAGAAHRLA